MKKVKIWRSLISSIISIGLICIIPWLVISVTTEGDYSLTFSLAESGNTYVILMLVFGILYFNTSLIGNVVKGKSGKTFGTFSAVFGFLSLVILSIHTFISGTFIAFKLAYFMPIFSLFTIDLVLAIVSVSIKPEVQQVATAQQELTAASPTAETAASISMNGELTDVSDLKNKILNMKIGLNKSYEEAMKEIEKTGSLNGLDMSDLLREEKAKEDSNKIVPLSVEQYHKNQFWNSNQTQFQQPVQQQPNQTVVNEVPNQFTSRREQVSNGFGDPLANSSSDYESIQSSSLSRKDYKYTSRRNDIDENKH